MIGRSAVNVFSLCFDTELLILRTVVSRTEGVELNVSLQVLTLNFYISCNNLRSLTLWDFYSKKFFLFVVCCTAIYCSDVFDPQNELRPSMTCLFLNLKHKNVFIYINLTINDHWSCWQSSQPMHASENDMSCRGMQIETRRLASPNKIL